jgi:nuclear transport factor 2 (NTF2) superfamily protein
MNFDLEIEDTRQPLPPFTKETAIKKVRIAEDAWNNKNAEKIATAYSLDSQWRNRDRFIEGRPQIIEFLTGKWQKELEYRLIKELWAYEGNRIAVRYVYEWRDQNRNWFRSHGNENWEFNEKGLMTARHDSINDVAIKESERKFHWPIGPIPEGHPELSELSL